MKRTLHIYLAGGILALAACSSDDPAWRQAREENTERSYAAYARAHPKSKHTSEAFQQIDYLRFKEPIDKIFMDLKDIYGPDPGLQAAPPGKVLIESFVDVRPAGFIVLTVNADATYRINKDPVASDLLEETLRNIFEVRQDKSLLFRIMKPVKDYKEIVDFMSLLMKAGVERPIPIITPQIEDVVRKEFKGAIDLPILKKERYIWATE